MKQSSRDSGLIWVILTAALTTAYAWYCWRVFLRVPMDCDYASLILEARDILDGNLLLREWRLTGISFLTTDLLYFVAGVAVFGVNHSAYVMATTGMFLALIAAGVLLVREERPRRTAVNALLLIAAAGFPSRNGAMCLRTHTGGYVWLLAAVFFLDRYFRAEPGREKRRDCVFFAAFLTLGVIGDAIVALTGCTAAILVCVWMLMRDQSQKERPVRVIAWSAGAFAAAFLADRLYFMGGAVKNSFLSAQTFRPLEGYPDALAGYANILLALGRADFPGKQISGIGTMWLFLRVLVLLFGLYAVARNLSDFFRGRSIPIADAVLSVGFTLISLGAIVINLNIKNVYVGRYISYAAVLLAVVAVRRCSREGLLELAVPRLRVPVWAAASIIAAVLAVSALEPLPSAPPADNRQKLGEFLAGQGLYDGYARFFDASLITVQTGGAVRVRPVNAGGYGVVPNDWFSKDDWYETDVNFVVVYNRDYVIVTRDNVISALGQPDNELLYGEYTVLVYYDGIRIGATG